MFREFDYIELGGTLYTPSTSKNLLSIATGKKFPYLKSVVFCLEDAIKDNEVVKAMDNIAQFLLEYQRDKIKVFIRPKDHHNLEEILSLENIEKIDGFSLAKFGTGNQEEYFYTLNNFTNKFHIMPVIESRDMFNSEKLINIQEFLSAQTEHNIITIRIGGEDMFKTLGIKKDCEDSIHDFHVSSKVFANILSIFKPFGFNVSAPVYNCIEHQDIFTKEVKRDIKEGFFGKTIIHPGQAIITNECYKASKKELEEAKQILDSSNEAVFRFEDKMCEPKAHNIWANNIIKRAAVYGVKE